MTHIETLKLALDALDSLVQKTSGQAIYSFMETERRLAIQAGVGLRQAIAEAELVQRAEEAFERSEQYDATSDHMLMENAQGDLERVKLVQTGVGIGKPEQEPVAWITQGGKGWLRWHKSYDDNKDSVPLYTAPPQRQPLTDEMAKQMKERCDSMEMRGAFADGWFSAEAAHGIFEEKK